MRRPFLRAFLVVAAIAMIAASCATAPGGVTEPAPPYRLKVDNQSLDNVVVYVVFSPTDHGRSLGTVPMHSTEWFVVPASIVKAGALLRICVGRNTSLTTCALTDRMLGGYGDRMFLTVLSTAPIVAVFNG